MANENRSVNRLTVKETLALIDWLRAGKVEWTGKTQMADLAVKATVDFGKTITIGNVKGVMEAADLYFPKVKVEGQARVDIIKRQVEILCDQLGVQLSPEWTDL